jgi:quercetin dioxygenase-like cupin family protein
MKHLHIPFPSMDWQQGGHPLERKKTCPHAPVTLLEFEPGFRDPSWCRRGHAGYILAGALGMAYEDSTELLAEGEAFHIEAGTPHQAFNPGAVPVRLLIVSQEAAGEGPAAGDPLAPPPRPC